MRMHNPPHPGEILRELCIEPLELTVTDAAAPLGVSRKTLSAILNGRAGIKPRDGHTPGQGFRHVRRELAQSTDAVRSFPST